MKLFTTSALALIAATGIAFADNHAETELDEAATHMEQAAEQTGDAMEDAGDAAAMAAEDAADATAEAADDVADMTNVGDVNDGHPMIRTRDITGSTIYTTNEANDEGWELERDIAEVGADWNDIGEIEDIVLDMNGKVIGVVAEVGGFLDIGDKHVMLPMEDVTLTRLDNDSYIAVTGYNEEQLEEMESVDEGFWD